MRPAQQPAQKLFFFPLWCSSPVPGFHLQILKETKNAVKEGFFATQFIASDKNKLFM